MICPLFSYIFAGKYHFLKKGKLYCILLLFVAYSLNSINSPQSSCVLVLSNGQALLTWNIPADPNNEFGNYNIYASPSATGGYTNVGTVSTYTSTNFMVTSCNANTQSWFFYVTVTNNLGAESAPLDTLQSIFLIITTPANSSTAGLLWNNIHNPSLNGETAKYNIYKEFPIGNWTQIASQFVNNTGTLRNTFTDVISVCHDSINYRIELLDSVLGCTSVSNVKGNWFKDKTPPSIPILDSVSVNAAGQAILSILPSSSPDNKCYVIYIFNVNSYTGVDTICNNNQNATYTYTLSSAYSGSIVFSIAGKDSCENISLIDSLMQGTIFLRGSFNSCTKKTTVYWNPYKHMIGGVQNYEILYSFNGGPYIHLGDTTGTVYYQQNVLPGNNYCYIVRAHSNLKKINGQDTVSSTSNPVCIRPFLIPPPSFVYENDVTVNQPAENILVEWGIDSTAKIGGFDVYLADTLPGPYSKVGHIPPTGGRNYSYTDLTSNVNLRSYFYYEEVLDSCGLPFLHTDTSHTIFLTGSSGPNYTSILNWNAYGRWSGSVGIYNIYRSLNGIFSGTPVTSVIGTVTSYTDDVSNLGVNEGKFTYYIQAVEAAGDAYGYSSLSESNSIDIYQNAELYVPNAFFPRGVNKVFLPIGNFVNVSDFRLSIFNRWGQKIYETLSTTEGWDGGNFDQGLYVYLIQFTTALGEFREVRGTVTLLK